MKKNIMVVFGGKSPEHEISKLSAKAVLENINKDKYNVIPVGITKDGIWVKYDDEISKIDIIDLDLLIENKSFNLLNRSNDTSAKSNDLVPLKNIDIIFPVLHGPNGEDGTIQGLLEVIDKPYIGCGVIASSVGMDKVFSKVIFQNAGIPQGDYLLINRKEYYNNKKDTIKQIEKTIQYPCFVKPCNAGSSIGVSKVGNRKEMFDAIELAGKYDRRILIEELLTGKEIECAVLGNDNPIASVVGEIKPCNEFYDYSAKYLSGEESEVIIPAKISGKNSEKVRKYALLAYKALDCSGLSRVDFFVDEEKDTINLIELNTMPGFTNISMYSKLWKASGIPYSELIDRLIDLAEERHNDKKREYTI